MDLLFDEERRTTAGLGPVPFGLTPARADLLIGLGAALAVAAAAVIVAEGGVAAEPTALTAVLVANIATLAVAGLLWRNARPSSHIGTLLLVDGLLIAVSSLGGSRNPAIHVVGYAGGAAATVWITYVTVSFPRARPRGGAWAVLSLAAATFVFGYLPLLLTSPTLPIFSAVGQCAGACPSNPLRLVDAPSAQATLVQVASVLQAVSAAGLGAYMILHFMQASRPSRRTLALLYAAMIPFVGAVAGTSAVLAADGHLGHGAQAAFVVTRVIAPLGFVGALLYARAYAAEALGYMSARLVGEPSLAAIEQLVRSVLDDPRARIAYWSRAQERFVDRHGKPIAAVPDDEGVSWWSLRNDPNPTVAIVHDSVLDEDSELLEAVGVSMTLALENRRLHHDLVGVVEELHASQKRLVSAAFEERRRLERDLHDGAQQKLVALRIRLALAGGREMEVEPRLRSELGELGSALDEVLDDLRSLAHGIFPPLLAEEGLGAALREAARRSAVSVAVKIEDPGRLTPECETAVYYCCLEALQNVAKHAGEDALATLRLWRGQRAVHFSVVDDGPGFVRDPDSGNVGLTNMADRIGAVDGLLSIRSQPGQGTKVEGRIPLDSASLVPGGDLVAARV